MPINRKANENTAHQSPIQRALSWIRRGKWGGLGLILGFGLSYLFIVDEPLKHDLIFWGKVFGGMVLGYTIVRLVIWFVGVLRNAFNDGRNSKE